MRCILICFGLCVWVKMAAFGLDGGLSNNSRSKICDAGLPWLNISISNADKSFSECLYTPGDAMGYISVDIPELHFMDGNFNHYFHEVAWPFAAYIGLCLPKRSHCNVAHLSESHWHRRNMSLVKNVTYYGEHHFFIFKSIFAMCTEEEWEKPITSFQPSCYMNVSLLVRASERGMRGVEDKERVKIFSFLKQGSQRLLARTDKPKPVEKIIIVYSRDDGDTGRRLVNAAEVVVALNQQLPHGYRAILIQSLGHLNMTERYDLFSSAAVIIAPHGGWIPNTIFMLDTDIAIPRMVFAIEKPWPKLTRVSYEVWDQNFGTSAVKVIYVTKNPGFRHHHMSLFCEGMEVVDWGRGDYRVNDVSCFVKSIEENFNRTSPEPPYVPVFKDGTLVRFGSKAIYAVFDDVLHLVPNMNVFMSYGYDLDDVIVVNNSTLFDQLPQGQDLGTTARRP